MTSINERTERIADIYVVKWWSTKGILLVRNAKIIADAGSRMASWSTSPNGSWRVFVHGPDFQETYENACATVEMRAGDRWQSLRKTAAKVKRLSELAQDGELPVTEVEGV